MVKSAVFCPRKNCSLENFLSSLPIEKTCSEGEGSVFGLPYVENLSSCSEYARTLELF